MRTNIDLDDDLMEEASRYCPAATKRALVREALVTYIATKREERRRLTYKGRLQAVRAKMAGLKVGSDSRDIVRKDRDSR